ncbi:MAG: 2-succinyl-5-enolpyruvyl-6-hydroxy-3-cyclohexene-1-carboxylic-acid synthase [Steroidobacteraceae bacterium]
MADRDGAGDVGSANVAFARALLDELCAGGLAAAFVCPGSRSTPLALAIAESRGLPHWVHVDERSAAFHALGYARATDRPVALVCTSGTAGANFLPAVAEAFHSRAPLVVLTADRPPELRAWGAAQTMEQRTLFAAFTRWNEEAPCPSERGGELAYARALARRALHEATGPAPGPVHLNLPFREPLLPASVAVAEISKPRPEPRAAASRDPRAATDAAGAVAAETLNAVAELANVERGVLVLGPDRWDPDLAGAVHALAATLGWPVLADPASGVRTGPMTSSSVIHGADLLLRDASTAARLRPDLVVRCGALPTSKAIGEWIARHEAAEFCLVDPAGGFRDPQHRANRSLRVGSRQFCELACAMRGTTRPVSGDWLAQWRRADEVARAAAANAIVAESRLLTPHVARALWETLPSGAALYVANSMPIRELDAFAGPREADLRVLANRGVNGIDGLVSAACGASAALGGPAVLWCGDLALLHDVSGLLAGRMRGADLTIVVSNDDGGGIFEYLPAARTLPRPMFESMFAVPHGLDLCAIARGLGWEASRVTTAAELAESVSRSIAGGRHLIEVSVDRAANTAFHHAIHAAVGAALRRESAA